MYEHQHRLSRREMTFTVAFALAVGLAILICVYLAGCGGSMNSSAAVSGSGVPMTLTIGDTPPSGVAVLFFEALITGVSLQPSDMTKPAVSALSTPVEIEFTHLQTDTAFLSLSNVPPETYKSMTLTFGSATLTIVNHSPGSVGGCAMNATCELTPSFSPTTAMISAAPFPVTIAPNTVVGIRLDFDTSASIQSNLSINPVVNVRKLTQRTIDEDDQEMDHIDDVIGKVTSVTSGAGGAGQFILSNDRSGQTFTIMVNSNTVFEEFDRAGCTANPEDLTCVKAGQVLIVRLSESGTGAMTAARVEFEEDLNRQSVKGTVTSVDSPTEFHMVVFNEEPAVAGIDEGSVVDVTIPPSALFQVGFEELGEFGGFSFGGLSFQSGADLMVGQTIQIRPTNVGSSGGVATATTALVRLWPSQISGTVGTVGMGTFTLTGLSPLFTGATPPVTTIKVLTLGEMDFEDFDSQAGPTAGQAISVKGLLFNTTGMPTLISRTIEQNDE